ncbi:MAG: Uma2 family endonuclease [Cyanobacteria bacterium J06639_1]
MGATLAKWTVADYHRMIDSQVLGDRKVELLAGDIVEMAPERPIHASTNRKCLRYLQSLFGDRAEVLPPGPIDLSEVNSEPEPDIAVVIPPLERYDDHHPKPDEIYLLIEISNTTLDYDLNEKARAYAAAGIRDYWVVDVRSRRVWIHRQPDGARYGTVEAVSNGTIFPLTFPDLKISVEYLLN